MLHRTEAVQLLEALLAQAGVTHFSPDELMPYRVGAVPMADQVHHILPTVLVAERVRDHFDCPVFVNSAYRSPAYNKKVGGAPESMHVQFNAMDIVVRDYSPDEVVEFLETLPEARYMGIGKYANFVHIDTRGQVFDKPKARW